MAGTMKAASGRSTATTSSQRPASNLGRKKADLPSFIGLYTKLMPAKVNRGEPCSQAVPVQGGSLLGRRDALRCRTTTPLGEPVVPEVYMMSARSSGSRSTWKSPASFAATDSHGTTPGTGRAAPPSPSVLTTSPSEGTLRRAAASASRWEAQVTAADASAWPRMVLVSAAVRRVLVGTATAPALCTAA